MRYILRFSQNKWIECGGPIEHRAIPDCEVAQNEQKSRFLCILRMRCFTNSAWRSTFIKIWRLRNVGSCTWDKAYALVREIQGGFKNDCFITSEEYPLEENALPGQTVDISVNLHALQRSARFKCNGNLRND
jgi:hypothetical protein